jgi:hypothetical protein
MATSPGREGRQGAAVALVAERAQGRPSAHAASRREGKRGLAGLVASLPERLARIAQVAKVGLGQPHTAPVGTGPATALAERERCVRAAQAPELAHSLSEQLAGRAEADRTKSRGYNHRPDQRRLVQEARHSPPARPRTGGEGAGEREGGV